MLDSAAAVTCLWRWPGCGAHWSLVVLTSPLAEAMLPLAGSNLNLCAQRSLQLCRQCVRRGGLLHVKHNVHRPTPCLQRQLNLNLKLAKQTFRCRIWYDYFRQRIVNYWNGLPSDADVVNAVSVNSFKNHRENIIYVYAGAATKTSILLTAKGHQA